MGEGQKALRPFIITRKEKTMVVIPDSEIFLLKSPLQIDNKNQLTFTNATAQYNYFSSLTKLELDGATYQRKDGAIRFEGNFDDLVNYNYCMYKNTNTL